MSDVVPGARLRVTDDAYRRRIELRPSPGVVAAAMEDYVHHFAIRLHHADGVVVAVEVVPERVPWSSCPGGAAGLHALVGHPLAEVADLGSWMGGREHQCVHTVDLAVLAAGAALRGEDRTYEVWLTGIASPRTQARLLRDGAEWATWRLAGDAVVDEGRFAGLRLDRRSFSAWIAEHLDDDDAEAAFVLRRGMTIGLSRVVEMDGWDHPDDARPADSSCLTYAPEAAAAATVSLRVRATEADGEGAPVPAPTRGGVEPVGGAA